MNAPEPIQPIPGLEFFEGPHKYRYLGEWIPYSMTQVTKGRDSYFTKTLALPPDDPERINLEAAIKRGNAVHKALEQFNLGQGITPNDYGEWIEPVITNDFWSRWRPVPGGVELSLIDPRPSHRIAGRCDLLVYNIDDPQQIAIVDYKTQKHRNSRTYSCRKQLGGYINLSLQMPQTRRLKITQAFVIWCRPGHAAFEPQDTALCVMDYIAARDEFFRSLPKF